MKENPVSQKTGLTGLFDGKNLDKVFKSGRLIAVSACLVWKGSGRYLHLNSRVFQQLH